LGQRFFETGPGIGQAALADYFTGQIARGRMSNENTERMAEHYISLLSGGGVRWVVLGLSSMNMKKSAQIEHVEAALRMFLRAYSHR
jgi:AefR-like transcriptional repressor, C-terminal domain